MKRPASLLIACALASVAHAETVRRDVPYAGNGHERQVLDIHAPDDAKNLPVVFWIHGGGWQQGDKSGVQEKPRAFVEPDSNENLAAGYERKLHDLIRRLRAELNAPQAPFLAGQLGQFEERPWSDHKKRVDRAHRDLPAKVPHTAFVASTGLKHKGDEVHFDDASCREFGKRYAAEYLKLTGQPAKP
jgi:hypothetical protein